jgi:predicted amidohydrolase
MSRPLSLALVQAPGRRADDLEGFAEHAAQVARTFPGARLMVYPELHCASDDADPLDQTAVIKSAERISSGPRHERFSQLAGDLGVWLCPGSVPDLGDDGHVYNTAVVYSPEGELVASYRKMFSLAALRADPIRRGVRRLRRTQDRPARPVGLLRRVVSRVHAAPGLDGCGARAERRQDRHCGSVTGDRHRSRNAIVNQVFVASVNAAAPSGVGHSLLVDPEGHIIGETPGALPGVLTAVIDLDAVTNARRFGTCGLTRVWSQLRADDEPIQLPLYGGALRPDLWLRTPGASPDAAN